MHPLAGIEAKIDRADLHFRTLKDDIEAFLAANPAAMVLEPDVASDEVVIKAKAIPPSPLSWGVILGDFIHNLRSTLDHLVWQIVLVLGGTPDRRTSFPIYEDQSRFDSDVRRPWSIRKSSALAGVDVATFDTIEKVQPYNEPAGRVSALAVLATLSNIDKHRLLHGSILVMSSEAPTFTGTGFSAVQVAWGPVTVKPGAEVARLRFFGPPDREIEANGHLVLEVRFGDMQIPISRLLDVRNAVVSILNLFGQGFHVDQEP